MYNHSPGICTRGMFWCLSEICVVYRRIYFKAVNRLFYLFHRDEKHFHYRHISRIFFYNLTAQKHLWIEIKNHCVETASTSPQSTDGSSTSLRGFLIIIPLWIRAHTHTHANMNIRGSSIEWKAKLRIQRKQRNSIRRADPGNSGTVGGSSIFSSQEPVIDRANIFMIYDTCVCARGKYTRRCFRVCVQ